jgi:uncharacterized protein YcsI (UPF0317 family)
MKRWLVLILLLHFVIPMKANEWIKIRNLYEQAAIKEDAQLKLNKLLLEKPLSSLSAGYKGANLMVSAKYTFNPIRKLSRFNRGKDLMEQALKNDPKSFELRYIRFTIQTNLPGFLGYSANVNMDKEFLISKLGAIADVDLKNRVIAYLISSKKCNESELKEVMIWKNKLY